MRGQRGTIDTALAIWIFRVALGAGFILAAWWGFGEVIDAIRAPAIARAEKAEQANATLVTENKRLEEDNKALNRILAERDKREEGGRRKLEGKIDEFGKLLKDNLEAREWGATRIPDAVIDSGLRTLQGAGSGGQGRVPGPRGSNQSDSKGGATAAAGARRNELGTVGPEDAAGSAGTAVQRAPGRCDGVESPACKLWRWITG